MKYPILTAVFAAALASSSAHATNITVFDGVGGGGFGGGGTGVGSEDNEVENGAQHGQHWDLEAFVYDSGANSLSLWGGYNSMTGQGGWGAGDIFIDINGGVTWGAGITGRSTSNADYGYEYAIVFDRVSSTLGNADNHALDSAHGYSVYALSSSTQVLLGKDWSTGNDMFDWSNPFRVNPTSLSGLTPVTTGTFGWAVSQGPSGLGLLGHNGNDTHYKLTVNLDFLGAEVDGAFFHYTMGCGNDGINGYIPDVSPPSVPDAGTTLTLLGLSIGALGLVRRRK